MSFRLDHVVIIVPSLAEAVRRYADAGFTVTAGGQHDAIPTENALIALADGSYLELMAVRNDEARDSLRQLALSGRWESHLRGASAIGRRFLPRLVGPPGVGDYALYGSDLQRFAAAARRRGFAMTGPMPLARRQPDGTHLEMGLLLPAANHLPFLIEDRTPRARRVPGGAAATTHANGASGIAGVTIRVANVPAAALELASLFDGAPRVDAEGVTRFALAGIELAIVEGEPARACELALVGMERLPAEIEQDGIRVLPRGHGRMDVSSAPKTLHTLRLRLEPLEESHADALFEGLQHEGLYEFISDRAPESVAALRERYRRLATRVSPDGREAWLNWAVWSPDTHGYVGWVQATVHPDRSAHVAYVLFREAWGHGYAREAVAALIDHLRDDWSAWKILATADTRNRRSIALLETLGFVRGEVRAEAEEIRGVLADEVEYFLVVR